MAEGSVGGNAVSCIMQRVPPPPPRIPPTHSAIHHAHLPTQSGVGASTGDHDLLSRLQRRHAVFNSCAQVLRQRLRVTNYSNGPFNATKGVFHGGASP